MTTIARRFVSAGLLAAILAGGCSGGDGAAKDTAGKAGQGAGVSAPPKLSAVYSEASGLRAHLTALLQQHVYLAGITTDLLLAGKDAVPATAVLDVNTTALGEIFSEVYGEATAQRFLDLWRQRVNLYIQFAQATAAGDQATGAKVKADLELYSTEFATFMNATNPYLPADAQKTDTGSNVNGFLGAVTATAKKDPMAISKLQETASAMPRTGAVLASGIVKQLPRAFPGTADGGGATLLATLTAVLQEHVYLLGITTRATLAGGDRKSPRAALEENSVGLANVIGSVYGDPAAKTFLVLWRRHIGDFLDFAQATAENDDTATEAATAALDRFRTELGGFLASLNPNLPKAAVAADFEDYVSTMLAVISAQAASDPAEIQRLQVASANTSLLGEILAGGIAKQFASKFS